MHNPTSASRHSNNSPQSCGAKNKNMFQPPVQHVVEVLQPPSCGATPQEVVAWVDDTYPEFKQFLLACRLPVFRSAYPNVTAAVRVLDARYAEAGELARALVRVGSSDWGRLHAALEQFHVDASRLVEMMDKLTVSLDSGEL